MKGPIKITRVSVCLRPRTCCCNADPQEHPAALSSECHCPVNHGKWPHCSLARSLFNNVRCDFAQAACVDSVYHLCQTLAQILCFTSNPARGQRFRYRSLKRFISKTSSSALEVSAATVDHAVERIGGWELWTFFPVIVHTSIQTTWKKAQFESGQHWKWPDLQDGIHQQSAPNSAHYFSLPRKSGIKEWNRVRGEKRRGGSRAGVI